MGRKKKIILIGGGGHCKSCIEVIESTGEYVIAGILDLLEKKGDRVLTYKIIGDDNELEKFKELGHEFLITIGQIKSATVRKAIFQRLKSIDATIATVISPLAHVSNYAELGEGTIVMHGVFVNADAKVGVNCIVNTKAVIEHDTSIADHCHISTGAIVNGNCKISNNVFIGSGAVISSQRNIGDSAIVGAGTVVIRDVMENDVVVGNPAKKLK